MRSGFYQKGKVFDAGRSGITAVLDNDLLLRNVASENSLLPFGKKTDEWSTRHAFVNLQNELSQFKTNYPVEPSGSMAVSKPIVI